MDEDVPAEAARALQQAGHELALVTETLGVRTDDVDVWQHAVETQAIVITATVRISSNWPALLPKPDSSS